MMPIPDHSLLANDKIKLIKNIYSLQQTCLVRLRFFLAIRHSDNSVMRDFARAMVLAEIKLIRSQAIRLNELKATLNN